MGGGWGNGGREGEGGGVEIGEGGRGGDGGGKARKGDRRGVVGLRGEFGGV